MAAPAVYLVAFSLALRLGQGLEFNCFAPCY